MADETTTKIEQAKREWRTLLLSLLAYPNVTVQLLGRPPGDYPRASVEIQLTHDSYRFLLEPSLFEPVVVSRNAKKKRVKLENLVGNIMSVAAAADVAEAANAESRARNIEKANARKAKFLAAIGPHLVPLAAGMVPGGEAVLKDGYRSYDLKPRSGVLVGVNHGSYQIEIDPRNAKLMFRLSVELSEGALEKDPTTYDPTLVLFETCLKALGQTLIQYGKLTKAEVAAKKKAEAEKAAATA